MKSLLKFQKITTLREEKTPDELFDKLEEKILKEVFEVVYKPLLPYISKRQIIQNDMSSLARAIQSGRLVYRDGKFSGKLNAELSKSLIDIGAVYRDGFFRMPEEELPPDISIAIENRIDTVTQQAMKIESALESAFNLVDEKRFDFSPLLGKALRDADGDIQEKLKGISVAPELSVPQMEFITKEYSENLERYIKDFCKKDIQNLRERIKQNVIDGNRYETLIEEVRTTYGVSERKAKFLARQETKLMVTAFKVSRYKDSGSLGYIWKNVIGSPSHPVRDSHKILNNQFFTWDNPPVTNDKGQRNHPGQDFNCRCTWQVVFKDRT